MKLAIAAVCMSAGLASAQQPVRVVLDMDASRPGIQSTITVAPGTTIVPGVAVYIYDPKGSRSVLSIGFIGGIDRGISFGHMSSNLNTGVVTSLTGHPGTPVTANGAGFLSGTVEKGFNGPELHYIESGALTVLPSAPIAPVCTIDVHLANATTGDDFRFFLLDMVTVWRGTLGGNHAGAFSTQGPFSFDSGGDAVPDGTVTTRGIDPDVAVPVPPASFSVDYIDGAGGAHILIGTPCYANCDGSSVGPILTANDFQCFINAYAAGAPYANCDGSTVAPVLTANDFQCFINRFAAGCP